MPQLRIIDFNTCCAYIAYISKKLCKMAPPQKIRKITEFFSSSNSRDGYSGTVDAEVSSPSQTGFSQLSVPAIPECYDQFDIGLYVGKGTAIDDHTKRMLLDKPWSPSPAYSFPRYSRICNGKKRFSSFHLSWLKEFPWLAYSEAKCGSFCKACVMFASESAGGNKLGLHVTIAFSGAQNFSNGPKYLRAHASKEYHNFSMLRMDSFLKTCSVGNVVQRIILQKQQLLQQKKDYLEGLAMVIHLLGLQGIAYRGHRDSGKLNDLSQIQSTTNEGNLRAVLRLLIARGDAKIRSYMEACPANASYLSWSTQNDFIEIIGDHIRGKILKELKASKFFSVLADETSDVSNIEQLSILVRYVHEDVIGEPSVKEVFLGFCEATDLSGEGLSRLIMAKLRGWGIDLSDMRGQGYDGASAMSGKFNGVQAKIRAQYPLAMYVHCACHILNLALSTSSDLRAVRRSMSTIQDGITFLRGSPKRKAVLKTAVRALYPSYSKTTLVSLCNTRWVERHDAVVRFIELFEAVLQALNALEAEGDAHTSDKADQLLARMKNFEFVASALIVKFVAATMLSLSTQLQKVTSDLVSVCELVHDNKRLFDHVLGDADKSTFNEIFDQACQIATKNGIAIELRQLRGVPPTEVRSFIHDNIFEPYVHSVLAELGRRFGPHFQMAAKLSSILPINIINLDIKSSQDVQMHFKEVVELYSGDLPHSLDCVYREIQMWYLKWKECDFFDLPDSIDGAYVRTRRDIFPNIRVLLQIFLTIPCTTASVERSFSGLKLLKSYVRNRCGQSRLTGIAMMALHRNIRINYKDIMEMFLDYKPRR